MVANTNRSFNLAVHVFEIGIMISARSYREVHLLLTETISLRFQA